MFPNYLLPVNAITNAVQITGAIRPKNDADGVQKFAEWNGCPGWVVPVEIIQGTFKKTLPNGKTVESLNLKRLNVTVWSATKPTATVGDYVRFEDLGVGAVDGALFFQALGVAAVGDAAGVAELFDGE